jgi:hypothetical protein
MSVRDKNIVYCDLIADHMRDSVVDRLFSWKAGSIQLDLHPQHGYFQSTKKTFSVTDPNGRSYKVTVEEA